MCSAKSCKPRIVAIIQARLTSTRLPRKVLRKIRGSTILEHCVKRTLKAKTVSKVVVASPHYIPLCTRVETFIGDEHDVLKRFWECAVSFGAQVVVRVTADCPLIDPEAIDIAVRYFLGHNYRYVSFAPVDGCDVEVFGIDILRQANKFAITKYDREHVTPFMRRITKLSVDTIHDLEKVRREYELFK